MIIRRVGHKGVTAGQGLTCSARADGQLFHLLFSLIYMSRFSCQWLQASWNRDWIFVYSSFLFVCMDLHLNRQDTLHCPYWIVWISNPEPQVRENCKLTKGIPSGNSCCSWNSSCKFSQDPSPSQISGTLPVIQQPYFQHKFDPSP